MAIEAEGPVAVAGPSGAGKSTLLRLIAGLVRPDSGHVEVDQAEWTGLPVERRPVGFVFQDYALFPHLSVRANVAFGAEGRPVDDLLERLGIARLADAKPRELSGGERQRVAVARALARRPRLLLLDEPLSALDPATRSQVASHLASVLLDTGLPALVVTHSFEDAASLCPRVVVMEQGRITQDASPAGLLEAPATPFVAGFAGTNLLPGMAEGTLVALDGGGRVHLAEPASGPVRVLVAPWEITLGDVVPDRSSALNHLEGTIARVVPVGARTRVVLESGLTVEVVAETVGRLDLAPGRPVVATWKATATRVASASVD